MPMFKGVQCNRAYHLGWRNCDKTRDVKPNGNLRDDGPNYISVVRISQCEKYEKDGRKYYDPKDAPAIPLSTGGTWYGYGKQRKQDRSHWFWVTDPHTKERKQVLVNEYYTTPFYAVRDAIVYQGTIHHHIPSVGVLMDSGLDYKEAYERRDELEKEFNTKYFGES